MPLCVYEMLETTDPRMANVLQRGSKLEVFINESGDEATINGKKILFSELISRSDYYPLSRFVFDSSDILNPDRNVSIIKSCFNAYTWTQLSSLKLIELAFILQMSWTTQIIMYPETKNFWDAFWLLHVPTKEQLDTNLKSTFVIAPKYEPQQKFGIKLYSPRPIISGPVEVGRDQTVVLDFEYRNWNNKFVECDFDTFIKYDAGYLPKNKIQVVNGKAKIKVTALGLEAGDTITLKFSIGKIYTNAVEHKLTVI
jgi:hypothetical protein